MKEVLILEDSAWYHRTFRKGERVVVGEREFWDLDAMGRVRLVEDRSPVPAKSETDGRPL